MHYSEPQYPFDVVLRLDRRGTQSGERSPVCGPDLARPRGPHPRAATLQPQLHHGRGQAALAQRAELFAARGGYYYEHWDELDRLWREKVRAEIRELAALGVPNLPDVEDAALVTEGRGVGSAHALLRAYDRLLESFDLMGHYHFELLNLGYGAYLALYDRCRHVFPDISDQTVAKMVTGNDVVALRPDEELATLAKRAVERGVGAEVRRRTASNELITPPSPKATAGDRWLAEYDADQGPVVLLLARERRLAPPPLLDRRSELPIATIGSYPSSYRPGRDRPPP